MIIQLSGIDCSGKSTLAKKLSIMTGASIIKYSVPKEGDDFLKKGYEELDIYENKLAIYDRGVWGCFMYQDILDQPQMPLKDILAYAKEFTKRGNMIWWVTAPISEIIRRMDRRGDEFVGVENLEKIMGRYYQIFKHLKINNIPYYKIET